MIRPLFIPLKRAHYEAFESGKKVEEFRPFGPRWNPRTCPVGRPVILSLGYGKKRRLNGTVTGFRVESRPERLPGWLDCYGPDKLLAACIGITLHA